MSWARHLAMKSWIVLHNGMMLLVHDEVIKKRRYNANRKCDSGVTHTPPRGPAHSPTPAGEIQETLGEEDGKEEESCQGNLFGVPL